MVEMLLLEKLIFFIAIFKAKLSVCPFWSSSHSGMRHRKELPKQHCNSAGAEELGTRQERVAVLAARCHAGGPGP